LQSRTYIRGYVRILLALKSKSNLGELLGKNIASSIGVTSHELSNRVSKTNELLILVSLTDLHEVLDLVLKLVADLSRTLEISINLLVTLSSVGHGLNLSSGSTGTTSDLDISVSTGSLILGSDSKDTIRVNREGDSNLGLVTLGLLNVRDGELAEEVVVGGLVTLTLIDRDINLSLVINLSGVHLGTSAGDGGVTRNDDGHDTAGGLDTEREGSDIKEKEILGLLVTLAGKDSTLNSGTISNGLIGVEGTAELLATEELNKRGLDLGDTSRTTDKNDIVNVLGLHVSILKNLLDGLKAAREDRLDETLELSTSKSELEVLLVHKSLNDNLGRLNGRKLTLSLLNSKHHTLLSTSIGMDVAGEALSRHNLLEDVLGNDVINILTTKTSITTSSLDLEDTIVNLEDGNIEGTTTKIEDHDGLSLSVDVDGLAVKTISEGSSGRLVDDTKNLETSNLTSNLGSSTLRIVEVSRDSDDSLGDGETEVSLSSLLQVTENHGRDLFRSKDLITFLSGDLDTDLTRASLTLNDGVRVTLDIIGDTVVIKAETDETLHIVDSVLGVTSSLELSSHTNGTLAVSTEGDVRRGGHVTTLVGDDGNLAVAPERNAGVGGTKINTDDNILGLENLINLLLLLGSVELGGSSKTIVASLVEGINLKTRLESLLGLSELLQGHESSTLADISLDILRINLDSLVSILDSGSEKLDDTTSIKVLGELEVASRTVSISKSVLGISSDSLSEVLDGGLEIVLGESLLAQLVGISASSLGDGLHD